MSVIDDFIFQFENDIGQYKMLEASLAKELRKLTFDAGINAILTTRIKDPESLREKLSNRQIEKNKHYNNSQEIFDDIPDLVGGRIALYIPSDLNKIEPLLKTIFIIEDTREFPEKQRICNGYKRKNKGYCATHYRVRFSNPVTNLNPTIEIQVASVLMHAWSEVEHDLVYKQKKGLVSVAEYEILDVINGLMLNGEILLQELQRITDERIYAENKRFFDHYQLSYFLYETIKKAKGTADFTLGDVESLFKLYNKKDRLSKKKVENDLEKIDLSSKTPIAEQLFELYCNEPSSYQLVTTNTIRKANNYIELNAESVSQFVSAYSRLETELRKTLKLDKYKNRIIDVDNIPKGVFSENEAQLFHLLMCYRNELVHGMKTNKASEIPDYIQLAEKLTKSVRLYIHMHDIK